MIQDIYPRVYHNEYQNIKPECGDFVLIFFENTALIRLQDGRLRYPSFEETRELSCDYHYLFSIDNFRYFLACTRIRLQEAAAINGYHYENVSIFRTALSRHTAFAGITAHHLFNWYESNRFCGRCGCPMRPDSRERMLLCPGCRNMVYPRISPAVIVGIIHGDKLLMSKYAGRSYANYALIAGFTEIGESVEQTVSREVMEEVGLRVKNIRYYKSQPWAFSGSLLMGFFCDLDGSDEIRLDTSELAEAGWYSREEIGLEDDHVSLTREMIMKFKGGSC